MPDSHIIIKQNEANICALYSKAIYPWPGNTLKKQIILLKLDFESSSVTLTFEAST